MIKMNYGDAKKKADIISKYPQIFQQQTLNNKDAEWKKLRTKLTRKPINIPAATLPLEFKDILTADFKTLYGIYKAYKAAFKGKRNQAPYKRLDKKLKILFNYKEKQDSIANFFSKNFEIHTCHYCQTAYINVFETKTKKRRRHFDLDHVLNKAACPIVALSLFNFVPACPVCNQRLKKDVDISGGDLNKALKLSPTSDNYDFDSNVDIRLGIKTGKSMGGLAMSHRDDFKLKFEYADVDYKVAVDTFYLEERYNYHKDYALRLWDLKQKYGPSQCAEIAKIFAQAGQPLTPSIVEEDIFGTHFVNTSHRTFGKLHNDIIKQKKLVLI